MLKRFQKSLDEKDEGFTLIELLVVVVIIGILAAIAIPAFLSQREKAADAATKSDLKNSATLMETWFVDKQTYAGTAPAQIADLKKSTGVDVTIKSADTTKYCLTATNAAHTGTTFYYDSAAGGLLTTGTC